ncbi:MAG: hypothetical protein NTZ68_04415 [Candidatus Dependentiae bacterium]|nr:hypothetical protein [Candidatus Dependentiae bacterium]
MINKQQVIDDLAKKIFDGENKVEIGKWAYAMYLEKIKDAENVFYDLLLDLAVMEYGQEHELSDEELYQNLDFLGVRQDAKYNKRFFGKDLKACLRNNMNAGEIGAWAFTFYLDNIAGDDRSYRELVYALMMMEAGPQMERSLEELNQIADRLIAGEDVKL